MKKFIKLNLKITAFIICIPFILNSQNITIDSTFTSDTEIFPFTPGTNIYGLGVSGEVTLNSDTSLVRLILIDSSFNEYLLYESYKMISNSSNYSFSDKSDETAFMDETKPYSIEVQIVDASIYIDDLSETLNMVMGAADLQKAFKDALELTKVSSMNSFIMNNNLIWVADTNSVSQLSYHRKKDLFGEKYNNIGLDYYHKGFYSRVGDVVFHDNSELVDHFDWRNRHGANVSGTGYYGGENGWMTITRNQNEFTACPNLCWLNAAIGQVESVTNLYFNQQLDIVLSLEQLIECDVLGCGSGYPFQALNAIEENGAYDQISYPDNNQLGGCREGLDPTNYQHKIFISGTESIYSETSGLTTQEKVDLLKTALITKGPSSHSHSNYMGAGQHSLVNVGYGIISSGEIIYDDSGNERDISGHIGELYWIYKNSWGESWGENGYIYHLSTEYTPTASSRSIVLPIIDEKDENLDRAIVDFDNDGYFNWGIGSPPTGISQEDLDSDDSNPRIGLYDDNFFGTVVKPKIRLERVIDNSPNETIAENSFYTFYDEDINSNGGTINLKFNIANIGTAQLNLIEESLTEGKISLEPASGDYFNVSKYPSFSIANGEQDEFDIQFTLPVGEAPPKIVKVIIELNEPDMDNFEFHLVFTECETNFENEYISRDVTWDSDESIIKLSDVHVQNGATLTIKGEVAFGSNCDLIVETGGKVLVDGGHLTSLCGTLWPGIDVWGNTMLDQYTISNQGYIYISNGGTISYAENGIETIRYDSKGSPMPNTTGGIVKIDNGELFNCTNGVLLYPYTHLHPYGGGIVNDISYFRNTKFYNNQEVMPNDQLHLGANELYTTGGVDGIRIEGCSFINENIPLSGESFGIKSVNSSFSVNNFTNEENEEIRTTFKGHNYGIHTQNDGRYLSSTTIVESAYFDNNETGIYISAIENPKILKNDFLIKSKFGKFIGDVACGLYLDKGTTGFMIEENNFFTELSGNDATTEENNGITVNNTGEDANEVYNNYFETLTTGITSAGTNRDDDSDIGLCIKCNDFANVRSDIYVTSVTNPTGGKQGIALNQGELAPNPLPGELGDPTYNAGNIFSEEYNDYTIYNFSIDDANCSPVNYTYQGVVSSNNTFKVKPDPVSASNNYLSLIGDPNTKYESKELSCPSNLGEYRSTILNTKKTYINESSIVTNKSDTLELVIDGGNTTSLILDVNTSVPNESLVLRQQLLNESPYLSDTVMKSAINKEDVLPNAMLRDILVANPQSAKSVEVMNTLYNKENSMPEYLVDEVLLGSNIMGEKDIIVSELSKHKTNRDKLFNELYNYYLQDTLNNNDSLISLLQCAPHKESRYKLARLYETLNDSLNTFSTISQIEDQFNLNEIEYENYDNFVELTELKWNMAHDTALVDSLYVNDLITISEQPKSIAGLYAKNMLITMGEIYYKEPHYFPIMTKSNKFENEVYETGDQLNHKLNIFPNPAKDYFTVETNIDNSFSSGTINLTTIYGKQIKQVILSKPQNQIIITTNSLPAGTYILNLEINGSIVASKKTLILK